MLCVLMYLQFLNQFVIQDKSFQKAVEDYFCFNTSNETMSKVATNLVSTIIEKDKVLVKNGFVEKQEVNESKETTDIASYWVKQLSLNPHPFMEETYFKETFIDPQIVEVKKNDQEENNNRGADQMTR